MCLRCCRRVVREHHPRTVCRRRAQLRSVPQPKHLPDDDRNRAHCLGRSSLPTTKQSSEESHEETFMAVCPAELREHLLSQALKFQRMVKCALIIIITTIIIIIVATTESRPIATCVKFHSCSQVGAKTTHDPELARRACWRTRCIVASCKVRTLKMLRREQVAREF